MKSQVINNAFAEAGGSTFNAQRETRWGYLIILLFFGSILVWSLLAPLSTATIAPGVITVDGYRKTVQHLEGGIVERILVRDGDRVIAGQPLIELQQLASETEVRLLQSQRALTAALEARLMAEQGQTDGIDFPDWLRQRITEPQVAMAIEDQRDIFTKRRLRHDTQLDGLRQQIDDARRELESYQAKAKSLQQQHQLARKELIEFRQMAADGLVPRTQVFARERRVSEADADINSNQATIASVEQRIGKLGTTVLKVDNDFSTEVAEQLRQARESLVDTEYRITKAQDRLTRTTVRAPVAGIVVDLQIHTIGGVIGRGQRILDLVPVDAEMIVEARVDQRDRDTVAVGMPAEIRLSAFNQRAFRPVKAEVVNISADALQSEDPSGMEGGSFYRAKVRFAEDPAGVLGGHGVEPGMQAEVLIVTGERSAIAYFIAPLFRSFNRALHEQ